VTLLAAAKATFCVPHIEAPCRLLVCGAVRAMDGAPGAPMDGFTASPRTSKRRGAAIGCRT
jgi:hypothetical protein